MALTVSFTSTINVDQIDYAGTALTFGAPNITITIAPGVFIGSPDIDGTGVYSDQIGSHLINNGTIYSGANIFGPAVWLRSDNGILTNNIGRSIVAMRNTVEVWGDNGTINNHGTITSLTEVAVRLREGNGGGATAANLKLNNDGEIYGQDGAVGIANTARSCKIDNSGRIHSDGIAISAAGIANNLTTIKNAASGLIDGTLGAIVSSTGRHSVTNLGTIKGAIDFNAADENDTVTNSGRIIGQVQLGGGNDFFNGAAGSTAVTVRGEAGIDQLFGSKVGDTLDGGANADTIRGGLGRDLMTGGADNDTFDFNAVLESRVGAQRDRIIDFSRAQNDRIDLAGIDANTTAAGNQAFKFIGAVAFHDTAGELRFAGKVLQGDVNGDGRADFEISVNIASMVKGDFVL